MSATRKEAACLRSVEEERQHRFADALDGLFQPTPAQSWLERAGPIARRMNEESKDD